MSDSSPSSDPGDAYSFPGIALPRGPSLEGEVASRVDIVANAAPKLSAPLRARLLQILMIPIGPLAMTVLAGGAFAKYAAFARQSPIPITAEDAALVTSGQVAEIARYLEQADPSMLAQVAGYLCSDPSAMTALGASVAAIAAAIASRGRPA